MACVVLLCISCFWFGCSGVPLPPYGGGERLAHQDTDVVMDSKVPQTLFAIIEHTIAMFV